MFSPQFGFIPRAYARQNPLTMKNTLLAVLLTFLCGSAFAAAVQDRAAISRSALEFLQQQTAALPGRHTIQVSEPDTRLSFAACERLQPFLPAGSRLFGRTSVGVRCEQPTRWSLLLPVQIKVTLDLLVSAHQLAPGHVLSDTDLIPQSIETGQSSGYTDLAQIRGKVLRYGIGAGQILREDMLRDPYSVTQGQVVQVLVNGKGFSMRNEGVAMNNAAAGQTVQVRIGKTRVLSAIAAADGSVRLTP